MNSALAVALFIHCTLRISNLRSINMQTDLSSVGGKRYLSGYVTFDSRFLYFAVEASDPNPKAISAPYADHDQISGPDTVDGIAPAGTWGTWWQERVQAKRAGAPWLRPALTAAEAQAS